MNFLNKIKIANVFYDKSFQKYWVARFLSSLCLGTLSVCIAWQIYANRANTYSKAITNARAHTRTHAAKQIIQEMTMKTAPEILSFSCFLKSF